MKGGKLSRSGVGLMAGLVDDAGLFPPTALSMPDAVDRHRQDLAGASPVLTHRFLCPASRIGELRAQLRAGDRVRVGLIADTGADGLVPAVAEIADDDALTLSVVEFPLATTGQPDQGSALNAASAAVAEARIADDVALFVEPVALTDVDVLAPVIAAGFARVGAGRVVGEESGARRVVGVKLRCGGVRVDLFPTPEELAAALVAAARAGVVIKATAGLHHAVRYIDANTGFTHHGYLNLLVAVADAVAAVDRAGMPATDVVDGADGAGGAGAAGNAGGADAVVAAVAATLRVGDGDELVARATSLGPEAVARTRRMFASYGSCSTTTPLTEARGLGLTPPSSP